MILLATVKTESLFDPCLLSHRSTRRNLFACVAGFPLFIRLFRVHGHGALVILENFTRFVPSFSWKLVAGWLEGMENRLIKPKLRCRLLNLYVYKSEHIWNYWKYNWMLLQITFQLLEHNIRISSVWLFGSKKKYINTNINKKIL